MSVSQTSMFAYTEAKKNLNTKQRRVYQCIMENGPMCNQEISLQLDWDINRVTPRVQELRQKGWVTEHEKAKFPATNRLVSYWKAEDHIQPGLDEPKIDPVYTAKAPTPQIVMVNGERVVRFVR